MLASRLTSAIAGSSLRLRGALAQTKPTILDPKRVHALRNALSAGPRALPWSLLLAACLFGLRLPRWLEIQLRSREKAPRILGVRLRASIGALMLLVLRSAAARQVA